MTPRFFVPGPNGPVLTGENPLPGCPIIERIRRVIGKVEGDREAEDRLLILLQARIYAWRYACVLSLGGSA
jgi:hypothetical protein